MKSVYPKSRYQSDEQFKYCFTEYFADGEKFHSDFYNREGAEKMAKILKTEGHVVKWGEVIDENVRDCHELDNY